MAYRPVSLPLSPLRSPSLRSVWLVFGVYCSVSVDGTWTLGPAGVPSVRHSAALVGSRMYVFGGEDASGKPIDGVRVLDLGTHTFFLHYSQFLAFCLCLISRFVAGVVILPLRFAAVFASLHVFIACMSSQMQCSGSRAYQWPVWGHYPQAVWPPLQRQVGEWLYLAAARSRMCSTL